MKLTEEPAEKSIDAKPQAHRIRAPERKSSRLTLGILFMNYSFMINYKCNEITTTFKRSENEYNN